MQSTRIVGPTNSGAPDCERILRSVPEWFGIEAALLDYVADSERFPTFFAVEDRPIGLLTVREHFPESWEIHCIAVESSRRGQGIGRVLHTHVEAWLLGRGVKMLQVKTLAASHPSREYAETRAFYAKLGYAALEIHPLLWAAHLPVLQLVKLLEPRGAA